MTAARQRPDSGLRDGGDGRNRNASEGGECRGHQADVVASLVLEAFHLSHEPPNNHPAVFAEYAASHDRTVRHLGQFAAFLVLLVGLLALLRGVRAGTGESLLTKVGEADTVITGAVGSAVLRSGAIARPVGPRRPTPRPATPGTVPALIRHARRRSHR